MFGPAAMSLYVQRNHGMSVCMGKGITVWVSVLRRSHTAHSTVPFTRCLMKMYLVSRDFYRDSGNCHIWALLDNACVLSIVTAKLLP